MKLSNIIFNYKENINTIKKFFITVSKEMVTVLWVTIVLLLIIWSYVENENKGIDSFEPNMYKISISDVLKID